MNAARFLRRHKVDYNILTTVHAGNGEHPLEVYRFIRDEVRANFIQFIPIVERTNETGFQEGDSVTNRSVEAHQYGRFLISIFDEWVRRDVERMLVQIFDVALAAWMGIPPGICAFSPTCGTAMDMEHNGDMYSCDHFVEPKYFLGNISEKSMAHIASCRKQKKFSRDKLDTLPEYCLRCEVRFVCNGECPKNRFIKTLDGKSGLNYLLEDPHRIYISIKMYNGTSGRLLLIVRKRKDGGAKVIDRLSADLQEAFPDMHWLLPRNLKYMRAFAAAWPDREIVQEVLAQITWYHNIALLEKVADSTVRLRYAKKGLEDPDPFSILLDIPVILLQRLHSRMAGS